MAHHSSYFAICVICYTSIFAFGAYDGAKGNDLLALDLQVQSVKAVLAGTNIIEALTQMAKRVDKGSSEPPIIVVPNQTRTTKVTCPICPKPQCPDLPQNGNHLQNQENITCPECPAQVTTVRCPEPITCPACPELTTPSDELTSLPVDCYEYRKRGSVESGIYKIYPLHYSIEGPVEVFCDMETDGGGWTVFQRRGDFGEPKQDFYLNWDDYKKGFGDLKREFWLGNDYIFALTNQKRVSLRVDLEDWEGEERYATYEDFLVRSEEEKYRVTVGEYAGNAGDSFTYNRNMYFSTKDRANYHGGGSRKCVYKRRAGWWFNDCSRVNPNGLYLRGNYTKKAEADAGVFWAEWKGFFYSLKRSEMKIRPLLASD